MLPVPFRKSFISTKEFPVLTREIIEAFIAEVQVHTDSRLTIRFRFEDEFEKLQQLAEMRKGA